MKRYLFAATLLFSSATSWALGDLADLTVYDRTHGRTLPVYEHDGRYYVVGKPGNRYQISLRNQSGQTLLAVTSVDGVNVVSGETANWQQTGYVLDAYSKTDVKGWRKNMSQVAQFYFTPLADSYAARTGRPDHVGVIGAALFRPQPVVEKLSEREDRADAKSEAPAASASGAAPARAEKKIGTGHGQKEASHTRYVDFERASETPDEIITIYYDSYRNLLAQGIIPRQRNAQIPAPFPGQFVPDPQN